jgi:hypothetical protein
MSLWEREGPSPGATTMRERQLHLSADAVKAAIAAHIRALGWACGPADVELLADAGGVHAAVTVREPDGKGQADHE